MATETNRDKARHLRSRARQVLADRRSILKEDDMPRTIAWMADWALELIRESRALRAGETAS